MRIRVTDVLDLLAAGLSPQEVVEELPDLETVDVLACPGSLVVGSTTPSSPRDHLAGRTTLAGAGPRSETAGQLDTGRPM